MATEGTTVLMDASDWSPRISFSHNTALMERISLPKENHPIPDFGFEFSSFLSADLQPFEQRMMPADELFCNGKLRPLARRCENASDVGMVQSYKTNGKVSDGGRSLPKRTDWGETENMGDGGRSAKCGDGVGAENMGNGGRSPRSKEEKKKKMGDGRRSLSPRRGGDKEAEEEKKMTGDGGRCSFRDTKAGEAESGSEGGRGQSPTSKLGRAKAVKAEDERDDGKESMNDDGKAGKKKGWGSGGMKAATTKKSCSSSHIELLKLDMAEEEEDEEEMKKISRSPRCASMEMGGSFCKSRHNQHHHHRYHQEQQQQHHYHHYYHHHHHQTQQQWNPHHHHHYYHHHHHQNLQPTSKNRSKLLNRNSISLNNSRSTSPSRSLSSSLPCTAPASPTTSSSSSRFSATFFTSSSSSSRYCHRVMDFLKLKKLQPSSSPRPLSSTSERSSSFTLPYATSTSSTTIKLGISSPRSFWPFSKPKTTTTCPTPSSRSSRSFSTKSFHEDIHFCSDCCCVAKNHRSSSFDSCTTTPKNLRTNGCTTNMYSSSLTNPGLSPFPLSHVSMIDKAARKSAGDQASVFMANGPTTDVFSGDEHAWDCGCMKECTTSKASIALQHPYSINYLKQQQQQQGKYKYRMNVQQRESIMVGSRGIVGTKCIERAIPYASSNTSVRVTPILNVPGCMTPSLRKTKGSSKSKSLGFPNLFPTKKNVSMAYHLISNNAFDHNPLA